MEFCSFTAIAFTFSQMERLINDVTIGFGLCHCPPSWMSCSGISASVIIIGLVSSSAADPLQIDSSIDSCLHSMNSA